MKTRSSYKWGALLVVLGLILLIGGCAPTYAPGREPTASPTPDAMPTLTAEPSPDPAPTPQPTPEPTEEELADDDLTPEIPPNTDTSFVDWREVSLYFRMQEESMLACETRNVSFPKDSRVEDELIKALLRGPSASMLELTSLFPPGTQLIKTWQNESMLFVTLSKEFLGAPVNAPLMWETDTYWRPEVYLRRQLALASIVNTVTEMTNFTSVQFLVADQGDDVTGRRLQYSEIYDVNDPPSNLLAPLRRDESRILTHHNTAGLLLGAWQQQTFTRLYRYVAQEASQRPTEAAFVEEMESVGRTLISHTTTPGSVSYDGTSAVFVLSYEYVGENGKAYVQDYPLRLVRERGIWKITYAELLRLMEAL